MATVTIQKDIHQELKLRSVQTSARMQDIVESAVRLWLDAPLKNVGNVTTKKKRNNNGK